VSGPEAESVSADRVTATRRIAAPAHAIFLLVSDPTRHVDIDGSGMLQAAPDTRPLTAVGQTFDMDMDRRPLGDIPNMAEYKVRCTVTQLIPDRLIEWTVRAVGKPPAGHVYGWQIEPLTDGECLVSNYCDWTNIGDELRERFRWPVVPVDRLENSVENLDRLATEPDES
jgi:Polyketide cyclase / dehydrase and lipid transport